MRLWFTLVIAGLVMLGTEAQQGFTVTGVVVDHTGAVIPGSPSNCALREGRRGKRRRMRRAFGLSRMSRPGLTKSARRSKVSRRG